MARRSTSPTPVSPEVLTQPIESPGGTPHGGNCDTVSIGESSQLTPDGNGLGIVMPATPDVVMPNAVPDELWQKAWLDARRPPSEWLAQDPVVALSDITKPLPRIVGALSATRFIAERLGGDDENTEAAWKALREDETWRYRVIDEMVEDVPQHHKAGVAAELRSLLFDKLAGSDDPLLRLLVRDMHGDTAMRRLRECQAWDAFVAEVDACCLAAIAHRALVIVTEICIGEDLVKGYEYTECPSCYHDYFLRTEAEELDKRAELAKLLRDKAVADTRIIRAVSEDEVAAMVDAARGEGHEEAVAHMGIGEDAGDTAMTEMTEPMAVTWCSLHPCMHYMCHACAMRNIQFHGRYTCPYRCPGEIAFVRPIVRR